jgi:hypothetical protein
MSEISVFKSNQWNVMRLFQIVNKSIEISETRVAECFHADRADIGLRP